MKTRFLALLAYTATAVTAYADPSQIFDKIWTEIRKIESIPSNDLAQDKQIIQKELGQKFQGTEEQLAFLRDYYAKLLKPLQNASMEAQTQLMNEFDALSAKKKTELLDAAQKESQQTAVAYEAFETQMRATNSKMTALNLERSEKYQAARKAAAKVLLLSKLKARGNESLEYFSLRPNDTDIHLEIENSYTSCSGKMKNLLSF